MHGDRRNCSTLRWQCRWFTRLHADTTQRLLTHLCVRFPPWVAGLIVFACDYDDCALPTEDLPLRVFAFGQVVLLHFRSVCQWLHWTDSNDSGLASRRFILDGFWTCVLTMFRACILTLFRAGMTRILVMPARNKVKATSRALSRSRVCEFEAQRACTVCILKRLRHTLVWFFYAP